MRRASTHRGITENPPGSNCDTRPNSHDGRWGIRKAQLAGSGGGKWALNTPWCGWWARFILAAGGVLHLSSRLASVTLIEDDARAGKGPFRDWRAPTLKNLRSCLRGDLVVWFGRGVHVGVLRSFHYVRGVGWVIRSEDGNSSAVGSQSNGGVSICRTRPLSQAHGLARVDFPGGASHRAAATLSIVARSAVLSVAGIVCGPSAALTTATEPSSDARLLSALEKDLARVGATQLRAAVKAALTAAA